jgi:hypothetical protein
MRTWFLPETALEKTPFPNAVPTSCRPGRNLDAKVVSPWGWPGENAVPERRSHLVLTRMQPGYETWFLSWGCPGETPFPERRSTSC